AAAKIRSDTQALEQQLAGQNTTDVPEKLAIELAVLARLMNAIGGVYTSFMRFDDAQPLLEKALTLRRRLLNGKDLAIAESLQSIAIFHFFEGDFDAAERSAREALAIRRGQLGNRALDVASSEFTSAWAINFNLGARHSEAEGLMRNSVETRLTL